MVSTSPACRPQRSWSPSGRTASAIAPAHRTALPARRRSRRSRLRPCRPPAAVATQERTNHGVVSLDDVARRAVAQLGRPLGRADDVGEEHRREDAVEHRLFGGEGVKERIDARVGSLRWASPATSGARRRELGSVAPGICSAMKRASSTGSTWSSFMWITRVGACTSGSTCRTSVSICIRSAANAAPGDSECRTTRPNHRTNSASPRARGPPTRPPLG